MASQSVGAFAAKHRRIGECWSGTASKDGHVGVMISPVLDDPMRVAGVLAHELVHATGRHGHRGPFAKLARPIGLEGKMTATSEGEAFKQAVAPILEAACPYTVRITRKWLDEVGPPDCPEHGDEMREA